MTAIVRNAIENVGLAEGMVPEGWTLARVGDVLILTNGFPFKPSHWKGIGAPIIRIQNLNNSDAPFNYCPDDIPERYSVRNGDLLFAWSGTPGTSFGAHIWTGGNAWLNQHIFRVDFDGGLFEKEFLRLAINRNLEEYISQAQGGVGLAHITKRKFDVSLLALPPLSEQRRIVAKAAQLLGRVNAARDRLAHVSATLKRFRQRVLRAAFSGELTADWRKKHAQLEVAAALVRRVATRRQKQHTEQSAAAVEHDYEPPRRPNNLEPREVDIRDLPTIPEQWTWVYLPDLGDMNRGKSRHRPRNAPHLYGGPYPFIQTGDIAQSDGSIALHRQTYSEAGLAQSRLWPAGTVCITIAANIANSAILTYPACFPDSVVGVISDADFCGSEYLQYFVQTARADLEQFAPATAQKNINIEILSDVAVPVAPLAEQSEIVRRVNALFKLADTVDRRVTAVTARCERLRQAILARAFRGELVPTEAELARSEGRTYESASDLLARIHSERAVLIGREGTHKKSRPAKRGMNHNKRG